MLQFTLYKGKSVLPGGRNSAHIENSSVQVSDEFKLVTETLYLTISYIDRFLSVQCIDNSDFQLLGVACMCVAAKYEEIHPPQLEKFSYITDHVCTVDDISEAEAEVLQALQFRLSTPTAKVCVLQCSSPPCP